MNKFITVLAVVGISAVVVQSAEAWGWGHGSKEGQEKGEYTRGLKRDKLEPMERFEMFDVNKDGFLTKEEVKAGHQKRIEEREVKREKNRKEERHRNPENKKMFSKMDVNDDGFVTKSEIMKEHENRMKEMFSKMDANEDGKLSEEEMKSGREHMREKMKKRWQKR